MTATSGVVWVFIASFSRLPKSVRRRLRYVGQATHVGGKHMRLAFAKEILECRHGVVAAAAYGFHDGVGTAAIEPDAVAQVRCAHRRIALAFGAMAGGAVGHEL